MLAVWMTAWLAAPATPQAATLSVPAVDSYNVRVGTETFAGLYTFTTNTLLVETAEAMTNMGSDVIKFYMGSDAAYQSGVSLASNVTNLLTLARNNPSYEQVLNMPFRHFILWAYPFGNSDEWWGSGYNTTDGAIDYTEMYELTCYLLTNYNNSGKTFYLGHWEGDGYLNVKVNGVAWATNPSSATISGMIGWLNNRQKAVDDAKNATPHSNVYVFNYAEANRVRDAMNNGTNNNERVINYVAPYVTNLDYLSYSSYDAQNLAAADLYTTLNYMQAHLPTNKAGLVPGERMWIGEYGWGYDSPSAQEPLTRSYMQRLLGWNAGGQGLPYILFWEMYNNQAASLAPATNFYLISPAGVKAPCYYLHEYFLNKARLLTAQFNETNGALPTDPQFAALVSPMLNAPLAAPVNLTLTNITASLLNGATALVSATLAQGVYGDDEAVVSVYWGRQNGGANPAAWEGAQVIGVNTNFNPVAFTAVLTNLAAAANYYISFFASNASAQVWAPAAAPLSTSGLAASNYSCRMKISFPVCCGQTLANFPALVQWSNGLAGFSYAQFASPTGGDLRFTDAGGLTLLPHEINQWNTNGVSSVWVQVPALRGTNTSIWAYWGNPAATTPPAWTTNGAVWQPPYLLVWHLEQSGLPYQDSAALHPAASGVAPGVTAGAVGSGGLFNGGSSYLHGGVVNVGGAFTLFAWAKVANTASNIQTLWANKPGGWNSNGFALYVNTYNTGDQKLLLEDGDGVNGQTLASAAGAVTPGTWHALAAAVNETNGTAELYVDGRNVANGSTVTDFADASGLDFGRLTNSVYYFDGSLDEARIASGVCSSNWIWATWLNVASNSVFNSVSPVNAPPSLSLAASAAGTLLTWPAAAGVFALCTTTNLNPPVVWLPASNTVTYVNGQWQAPILPPTRGNQFYRLQAR